MNQIEEASKEELIIRIKEVENSMKFLQKQIRERELRIQLYQFAYDKVEDLIKNLHNFPNLRGMWQEFEIVYKLCTGQNLIRSIDLENQDSEFQRKISELIKENL